MLRFCCGFGARAQWLEIAWLLLLDEQVRGHVSEQDRARVLEQMTFLLRGLVSSELMALAGLHLVSGLIQYQ